jgi:MFS family permease
MSIIALRLKNLCPFRSFNEFFIAIVYFVQGSGGITAIASSLILREELQLDFYQMGLIGAVSVVPWSVKPLYGILSDLFPIGGFRRRPYLHIAPLLAVAGYAAIALYAHDFLSFIIPLVIANIGLGFTDVATDGLVVEQSTEKTAGRLQGISQGAIRVAALITGFFSGLLIARGFFTNHEMYFIAAALPLMTFVASFFVQEQRVTKQTATVARSELSLTFIVTLAMVFCAIIGHTVFPEAIAKFTGLPGIAVTLTVWGLFVAWMAAYFWKLKQAKLTTSFIFLAALFILLWRFNPGAGSPLFFYTKDTLKVSEEVLGFMDTAGQVGSILAVILAVKFFDRFNLKSVLLWTVTAAALFGFSTFAVTRPEFGVLIGDNLLIKLLGTLVALPAYFFEMFFSLFTGGVWQSFWQTAWNLRPIEHFLYLQGFCAEILFMLAYIPLLKFAVLVTPKKAEATNFAVIASIMNIGLAATSFTSGWLYEQLKDPTLAEGLIDVSAIEILIWINIATSFACLLVWPWLKRVKRS